MAALTYADVLKFNRRNMIRVIFSADRAISNSYFKRLFRLNKHYVRSIWVKGYSLDRVSLPFLYFKGFINMCERFSRLSEEYNNLLNNKYNKNNIKGDKLGIVTGISDNIVTMVGLYNVSFGEMIEVLLVLKMILL